MTCGRQNGVFRRAVGNCLALIMLLATIPCPSAAASPTATPTPKRWIQFELMESEESGVVRVDKDLVLSITVGGVPTTSDSLLATIESVAFQSQTVSLSQDSDPMTYQGTAILEPKLRHKSRTTVHPKATRLRVTLARAKSTGLEEFMKRDVYITLGEPALEEEPAEASVECRAGQFRCGYFQQSKAARAGFGGQCHDCRGGPVAAPRSRRIRSLLEAGQWVNQPELESAGASDSKGPEWRDRAGSV